MWKNLPKLGLLSAMALCGVMATDANAQDKIRWKMQSAFASTLTHLGPSGLRFSKNIDRMSDGKFEVKFFEPGALVPPLECFEAVSKGWIEFVLDDARLPHGQVCIACLLHHGAIRSLVGRVPGLEVARRWQQAAGRDLRQAWSRGG